MTDKGPGNEHERATKLAQEVVDIFDRMESRDHDRSSDASKWLLAALLTLNGGGVVGILNAGPRFEHPSLAAACYVVGMVLAVLSAVALRYSLDVGVSESLELRNIAQSILDNEVDPVVGANLVVEAAIRQKPGLFDRSKISTLLELLSGAAFIAATSVAFVGIDRWDVASDRRCLAIQLDMLSAKPRRADDAEIFKALGCRSQGEGSVYALPSTSTKAASLQ